MTTIVVKMTPEEINVLDQPVLLGMDVARRLRKAGIPTMGKLWPYRVETGRLQIDVGRDEGVTFTWTSTPGEVVTDINPVLGVKIAKVDPDDEDLF
jgi:hypothetical protein